MITTVKYRGLLFAPEMARAVWENRKTQTRRAMNPQQIRFTAECAPHPVGSIVYVKEKHCRIDGGGIGFADNEHDFDSERCRMELGYRWTPAIHMRMRDARSWLRITDVRVERIHDISEADALDEGFDAKTCEAVLLKAAGRHKPKTPAWVRFDDGKETYEHWCERCAARHLKKSKKPGVVVLERDCPESDGPAFCEACDVPLFYSLTAYGVARELMLECDSAVEQFFAISGTDAAIAALIAGGIGDLREEHLGRLAQIGFATYIDQISGAGTWKRNPWVWVYTFERVERPDGI